MKRAGGECSEETLPCWREAATSGPSAGCCSSCAGCQPHHATPSYVPKAVDVWIFVNTYMLATKSELKTSPQCCTSNTDTPEDRTRLVSYWSASPAFSQQISILAFGHYPKGSFSLVLNSSHLSLHFTKEILIQITYSLIRQQQKN